jgi:hypothetical protein
MSAQPSSVPRPLLVLPALVLPGRLGSCWPVNSACPMICSSRPCEVTSAHEITQLMDGCVVLESMARHENHADGLRGFHERPCRIRGGRHGLFDKHMLPCGDCSQGKRRVACWRRGDDYPGRGTEHADVLRSPITYSNDADSYSHRSHRHIPPLSSACGSGPFGVSPAVRSLAYLRPERHPRMSGRTYVRLG